MNKKLIICASVVNLFYATSLVLLVFAELFIF